MGGRGDAMRGPDPKLTTDRLEYPAPNTWQPEPTVCLQQGGEYGGQIPGVASVKSH